MVSERRYERAAENYLLTLRRSLRDEQQVARELEDAARHLCEEGHDELAQALREVIRRQLANRLDRYDP